MIGQYQLYDSSRVKYVKKSRDGIVPDIPGEILKTIEKLKKNGLPIAYVGDIVEEVQAQQVLLIVFYGILEIKYQMSPIKIPVVTVLFFC